jgi:hypothetical protein
VTLATARTIMRRDCIPMEPLHYSLLHVRHYLIRCVYACVYAAYARRVRRVFSMQHNTSEPIFMASVLFAREAFLYLA